MVNLFSASPQKTKKIGEIFAKNCLKITRKRGALVLGLKGTLGGGKTTFLQGFAKGFGIKDRILSPTFVILKKFSIPKSKNQRFQNFYHIDCYRVSSLKEISSLGFKQIISSTQNIVAIEWAERILKILPKDTLFLKFCFVGPKKRKISCGIIKNKANQSLITNIFKELALRAF